MPALLAFLPVTLCSQQHPVSSVQQLTDSIRSIVEKNHIPGLMVGITGKDSVIFSGGLGYADLQKKRVVDGQTLFRLGSVTKMFVALAILKLVEQGKLNLDDELKKIAPELPFTNKWESTHPVKIIHLLEHTAGFDDMKLNRMCSQDSRQFTGKAMMLFQKNSYVSRWQPGERFAYSNPGYVILGYIIEKLSGKTYAQYLTDNILSPLAMDQSNFNTLSKMPAYDTRQYVVHAGKVITVPSVNVLMPPAGALWSCSDDMVKFLRLLLNNGLPFFADSSLSEMETGHSSLAARAGLRNGYALANAGMYLYSMQAWHGHGGLLGTCFSTLAYNRKLGSGFIVSSNGNQPNYQVERLIVDFLEQQIPAQMPAPTATDSVIIHPYLGQYQFESPRNEVSAFKDRLMNTVTVYLDKHQLYVKPIFGDPLKLVATAGLQFAHEGANTATIVFTKNAEGNNVMVMDDAYFVQTSLFRAKFPFWVAMTAMLLAMSAALAGLFSLGAIAIGRVENKKRLIRVLPLAAMLLLCWSVMHLLQVEEETYLLSELTNINSRTMIIFSGTLLFGIIALLHVVLVISRFRLINNRVFAAYWLLASLSIFYIALLLFQNGWIGLRTWAM
ncbi:MAG: serine hydrolase domain-containing protein [Chitinophagaceae bacterium]